MAFILTILLLLALALYAANSKADKRIASNNYYKTHPPCKFQEEYLLACEYYHKYLFDGESYQDAVGDALRSARIDIYNSGYLPSNDESCGTDGYDPEGQGIRNVTVFLDGTRMTPHDPPNGATIRTGGGYSLQYIQCGLFDYRRRDESVCTGIGDKEFNTWKDNNKKNPKWMAYCKRLDAKFDSLVIQSLVDYGIVDGKIHKGEAYITERETIWHGKNPEFREYKTREFKTKWIDYNHLAKAPWPVRDIVHYNGKEYEKILELHKDELPVYLANKRKRKPMQPKQEPQTPYGR